MNKKILVIVVALLVCSMMLTPFALAKPWNPKSNEKFETFETILGINIGPIIAAIANPEWVNPNMVITSWVEVMDDYTITVDGVDYSLGADFEYSGVAVRTSIGAPFTTGLFGMLMGDKQNHFRVDYMYDFEIVPGGIQGTIKMLALLTNGPMSIRSLQGTGDLQNVQIQATQGEGFTHTGIVLGWPDIPPATP